MCHFPSIKKFRDPFLTYKVSFSSFFRLKKDTIQIFLQTSRETILDRKILERMDVKAPAAKQQRLLLYYLLLLLLEIAMKESGSGLESLTDILQFNISCRTSQLRNCFLASTLKVVFLATKSHFAEL